MPRNLALLLGLLTTASPGPLGFFYDLYTFRGDGGGTTVVAAFAVPAGWLEREEENDGAVRYRFDVTLVLADTARRSVFRTDDSVVVRFPRPPAGEHLLYTHIEVEAPPSASTLQRVIMSDATTPGIGQLYGSPFPIPDYGGDALMLSDVALAQPIAEAGWKRERVSLALLPTSQLPGSLFDVYYEIYNLPHGHWYTTEISVERVDESGTRRIGEDPVSIRFTRESTAGPDASLQELRRLDTLLPEGRYRLTVRVTDEHTDRSVTRSRLFQVHEWSRDATLVPALPRRG